MKDGITRFSESKKHWTLVGIRADFRLQRGFFPQIPDPYPKVLKPSQISGKSLNPGHISWKLLSFRIKNAYNGFDRTNFHLTQEWQDFKFWKNRISHLFTERLDRAVNYTGYELAIDQGTHKLGKIYKK